MLVNMVAADLLKWVAWGPVVVRSIHGWNNQSSDIYIQLHQTPPLANGTLTAGTVPACKSLLAQANNGFMYQLGPEGMTLSELLVALSTTEVNYTAVAAASGLDMTLDIDSQFACDGTEVVVGDLTTGRNTLQVWTEAAGAAAVKRLLRVDVKDNQNVDQLVLLVYAVDTVQTYSLVPSFWQVTKNATTTRYLGDAQCGLSPYQQDAFTQYNAAFANLATIAQHRGCTLNVTSLTNGYWSVGTLYGGTSPNVRAIYK